MYAEAALFCSGIENMPYVLSETIEDVCLMSRGACCQLIQRILFCWEWRSLSEMDIIEKMVDI